MPYNKSQVRLFQMVKHGKATRSHMSPARASQMLTEAGQSHDSGHKKKMRPGARMLTRG